MRTTGRRVRSVEPLRPRSGAVACRTWWRTLTTYLVALIAVLPCDPRILRADVLYWDTSGTTTGNNTGNGAGLGGSDTWDLSNSNWWDTNALTTWANGPNTAVFWGAAGTVTLGDDISLGDLTFGSGGYTLNTGAKTLTFTGTGTHSLTLFGATGTTITGAVESEGSVSISRGTLGGITPVQIAAAIAATSLTFNGTSTAGWLGTTTINNVDVTLSAGSRVLASTSGITLYGGSLTLKNANSTEGLLDRINNAAGINVYGGSSLIYDNATNNTYTETLGTITLNTGQLRVTLSTASGTGSQTLTFGGLTRNGSDNTSSVAFSAPGSPDTSIHKVIIQGVSAATPADQIIGPWATVGTSAAAQTDYAKYVKVGDDYYIVPADIAHSSHDTWVDSTLAYTNTTGGNITLGAITHNLAALRNLGASVTLAIPTGGNLYTYGILNAAASTMTISRTGSGVLSTPAGGGNLYLTSGVGSIAISSAIADNGGPVTLVVNGNPAAPINSPTLTLSGTNTFSGGVVLNSGNLLLSADTQLGHAANTITFNGSAMITLPGSANLSFARSIAITAGANATITSPTNASGAVRTFSGPLTGEGDLYLGGGSNFFFSSNSNTFKGAITLLGQTAITVASLADSSEADGAIRIGAATSTGTSTFRYQNTTGTPLIFNHRQFDIAIDGSNSSVPIIDNNSSNVNSYIAINTPLMVSSQSTGTKSLTLTGINNGANVFAGRIVDASTATNPALSVFKTGTGSWTLSNPANTYTGQTTIGNGTLYLAADGPSGGPGVLGSATTPVVLGLATGTNTARLLVTGPYTIGRNITVQIGNLTLGGINTTGTATFSGNVTLQGPVTLAAGDGGTTVFSGILGQSSDGAGRVTINSPGGVVQFTRINTYNGATTVAGGTLEIATTGSVRGTVTASGGGTLVVDGQVRNAVVIGNNGTLQGVGTVGSAEVQSGGKLSPGNSVGSLSIDGTGVGGTAALTLAGGSNLVFEFRDGADSAGAGWDLVDLAAGGTLTFSGVDSTHKINISLASWMPDNSAPGAADNFLTNGEYDFAWLFIQADNLAGLTADDINDHYADYFTIDDAGVFNDGTGPFARPNGEDGLPATFAVEWRTGGAGTTGLYLTYSAVPEPGSMLLAGLGSLAAGWYGRRRLRRHRDAAAISTTADEISPAI